MQERPWQQGGARHGASGAGNGEGAFRTPDGNIGKSLLICYFTKLPNRICALQEERDGTEPHLLVSDLAKQSFQLHGAHEDGPSFVFYASCFPVGVPGIGSPARSRSAASNSHYPPDARGGLFTL